MKAASLVQIKKELSLRNEQELNEIILRLSKFKKDNKELLTYLLFEKEDERSYIDLIKEDIDEQLEDMNTSSYYYMKKTIRKTLRQIKKYIRYSQEKSTEVELLLYFCIKLKAIRPSIFGSIVLSNLYHRQRELSIKAVEKLHEDLRLDYAQMLDDLATE